VSSRSSCAENAILVEHEDAWFLGTTVETHNNIGLGIQIFACPQEDSNGIYMAMFYCDIKRRPSILTKNAKKDNSTNENNRRTAKSIASHPRPCVYAHSWGREQKG